MRRSRRPGAAVEEPEVETVAGEAVEEVAQTRQPSNWLLSRLVVLGTVVTSINLDLVKPLSRMSLLLGVGVAAVAEQLVALSKAEESDKASRPSSS